MGWFGHLTLFLYLVYTPYEMCKVEMNLRGMNFKPAGQLSNGLFPLEGGQGYLGLERRAVCQGRGNEGPPVRFIGSTSDGYSGAIVEFDETHEFFSGRFDMQYSKHRPKMDIGIYTESKVPIPIAELCVKSKEWEYEREVRVARILADCTCVGTTNGFPIYVMNVPSDCIKSVILGERMKVSHQREIWCQGRGNEGPPGCRCAA